MESYSLQETNSIKQIFTRYQDNDCYRHNKPMDGRLVGKVLKRNGICVTSKHFCKAFVTNRGSLEDCFWGNYLDIKQ